MIKYFKAIPYALFSRDLYRDVAKRWEGLGFAYLFILLFVGLSVVALQKTYVLNLIAHDETKIEKYKDSWLFGTSLTVEPVLTFIQHFPTLRIESGKASSEVEQPHVILSPLDKSPLVIIDTTGEVASLAEANSEVLITDQFIFAKEASGAEKKLANFSDLKNNIVIDKAMLMGWLKFQPLLYFPGVLLVHFIVFLLSSLAFGIFGLILSIMMKISLDFKDNIRLACVTSTPIVLLDITASMLSMDLFAKPIFIYMLLHAAYIYHAVESNKK